MSSAAERGQIKETRVPRLIFLLTENRKSGTLLLKRNDARKTVFFEEGQIIESRSNALHDCLGQLLLKAGKISQQALDDSLKLLDGTPFRQGELLVRMGFLSSDELKSWLARQQHERIWSAFLWTTGEYEFHPASGPRRVSHRLSPLKIVHDGIYERLPLDFFRREFALLKSRHYLRRDDLDRFPKPVALSDPERQYFLHQPPEGTVSDLLNDPRLDELARFKFLYFCVQTGWIETGADKGSLRSGSTGRGTAFGVHDRLEQVARGNSGKNFYDVLGIGREADKDDIKNAYFALAAEYHPDRYSGQGDETRKMAEEVFTQVNTAFSTLSDESTRQAYDATYLADHKGAAEGASDMQNIVNAEIHYSRGMNLLKRKDFSGAAKAFQQALELNPKEPDYFAHLGWALFRDASVPGAKEKAKEHLKKAIELNPNSDRPYVFLGNIHKAEGHAEKAAQMFEMAMRQNPDNLDAMREIRMLTVRREKDQTIWKKLFKK